MSVREAESLMGPYPPQESIFPYSPSVTEVFKLLPSKSILSGWIFKLSFLSLAKWKAIIKLRMHSKSIRSLYLFGLFVSLASF